MLVEVDQLKRYEWIYGAERANFIGSKTGCLKQKFMVKPLHDG